MTQALGHSETLGGETRLLGEVQLPVLALETLVLCTRDRSSKSSEGRGREANDLGRVVWLPP